MTDTPDNTPEDDGAPTIGLQEEELPELYLSSGECWFPDAYQLCETHKIVGLSNEEGVIMAFVEGCGAIQLADILKCSGKSKGKLAAVK